MATSLHAVVPEDWSPCYHIWENLKSSKNGNVNMAVALRCGVFVIPRATNQYFPWFLPTYQQAKTWGVIRLVL